MSKEITSVDDVFGISRDVPLNYVARDKVDQQLIGNLTRGKHIVVHGGSKQGKTCLRKHSLNEEDYVLVQCSNRWSVGDLHAQILKRAGFQIEESTTRTQGGKNKIVAKAEGKILGFGASAGAEAEEDKSFTTKTAPMELDPEDVNDVIAALKQIGFSKYIVLEDFHYLPPETQRDFSVALKAFHEASKFCFIIVGVWLEENRLIAQNGDLTGRVISVNADRWTSAELGAVMDKGAELLGVTFDPTFKAALIEAARESVSVVQESCLEACRKSGVYKTQPTPKIVGATLSATDLVRGAINQQSARYEACITNFADGFQHTELEMYRWLLYPVLKADPKDLVKGLTYNEISKAIRAAHPEGKALNLGNLTQALGAAASLQIKKNIKPLILDYDNTYKRLSVVDRGFLLWLETRDRKELLAIAELPE